MDSTIEIRTTKNIVEDLLQFVYGHEWVEVYVYDTWRKICPSCGANIGIWGSETYRQHKSDCKLIALIKEAEAYIRVENELEEQSE